MCGPPEYDAEDMFNFYALKEDAMSSAHSVIIKAYRRILTMAKRNQGVHLTAEEVDLIATLDDAISAAVYAADEYEENNNGRKSNRNYRRHGNGKTLTGHVEGEPAI